jgi:hypothetical protein
MTISKVFKPEELDIAAAVQAIYGLLLEPPDSECTRLRRAVEASKVVPTRGPVDLLSER